MTKVAKCTKYFGLKTATKLLQFDNPIRKSQKGLYLGGTGSAWYISSAIHFHYVGQSLFLFTKYPPLFVMNLHFECLNLILELSGPSCNQKDDPWNRFKQASHCKICSITTWSPGCEVTEFFLLRQVIWEQHWAVDGFLLQTHWLTLIRATVCVCIWVSLRQCLC